MNLDERVDLIAAAYDAMAFSWLFSNENCSASNRWTYTINGGVNSKMMCVCHNKWKAKYSNNNGCTSFTLLRKFHPECEVAVVNTSMAFFGTDLIL